MADIGSSDGVQALLAGYTLQPDKAERINDLVSVVSKIIEAETGRTYGGTLAPSVMTIAYDGFSNLILPRRAFSVTSVVLNPSWGGSSWTGGTAIASSNYRLVDPDILGAYRALEHMSDRWKGFYAITANWETLVVAPGEDIRYAANYIASEIYKNQQSDPSGVSGSEGLISSARNVFQMPEIQMILAKYRIEGYSPKDWEWSL